MNRLLLKSTKSKPVQRIINEALDILERVGVPLSGISARRKERMAVCFLAVAGVKNQWKSAKENTNLKSREIIRYVNQHFEEKISAGSYDDIRRKDLKLLVLAELILNTGVGRGSATNDPTRGYVLHPAFRQLIVTYKTPRWPNSLRSFNRGRPKLSDVLARNRQIEKIPVKLPGGRPLQLSLGRHNTLQKAVIEEFLPRYGSDCVVLYMGDTSNKTLHVESDTLKSLGFFQLSHDALPDIVAYSEKNNWLYLIEAVYSSGPMSEVRVLELKQLLKKCTAELIFVTAFLTRADFRKWQMDIAWETEVWTAEHPDHLIHFNGHKFLGAY